MKVDPRHLQNLLAIVDHGTFRKAAQACGISQPALSASIAELERQVGAAVLIRDRRGAQPNEIGLVLARRARELRSILRATEEEVRLTKLGHNGPLSIGMAPGMSYMLADAISRLRHEHPDVAMNLTSGMEDELRNGLREGNFDLLFGPLPDLTTPPADIVEETLAFDPLVVIVPANSELAARPSLSITDLDDYLWLIPQPASPYYDLIASLLRAGGLPWPRRSLQLNSLPLGEAMISRGEAIMVGSRLLVSPNSLCRAIPLNTVVTRRFGIRYRRTSDHSPVAKAFIQALRDATRDGQ